MADNGMNTNDMNAEVALIAKDYVDRAFDRHKLRPIVYAAARLINKANEDKDAVSKLFYWSVFHCARGRSFSSIRGLGMAQGTLWKDS